MATPPTINIVKSADSPQAQNAATAAAASAGKLW